MKRETFVSKRIEKWKLIVTHQFMSPSNPWTFNKRSFSVPFHSDVRDNITFEISKLQNCFRNHFTLVSSFIADERKSFDIKKTIKLHKYTYHTRSPFDKHSKFLNKMKFRTRKKKKISRQFREIKFNFLVVTTF